MSEGLMPTPKAGAITRKTNEFIRAGDWSVGLGIPLASAAATIFLLPLALEVSVWFVVGYLPLIIVLLAFLVSWPRTRYLHNSEDYAKAYDTWMPKLRGTDLEGMGNSLLSEIWDHTRDLHVNYVNYKSRNCSYCKKRLELIEELAPNREHESSAVKAVEQFLSIRKELSMDELT